MINPTISLAGSAYPISPLTLGQLKAVGVGNARVIESFKKLDVVEREAAWFDGAYEVIAAATGLSLEEVLTLPGVKRPELTEALRAIYDECGMLAKKEDQTPAGEEAGAETAG